MLDQHEKLGLHKIYITDEGIVVQAPNNLDYAVQYKIADKQVTMWSPKKHFYCVLPYSQWIKEYRNMYVSASWYGELNKPISSTVEHVSGADYRTYKFMVDANVPEYWRSNFGQAKKTVPSSQIALLTTIELPIFPQAAEMVTRLYGLPSLPGIPIKLIKQKFISLQTTKCAAASNMSLPFFVPTPNFKKKPFSSQLFSVKFDGDLTNFVLPY